MPLDRLGQPGEDAGEPAAQRGGVVLGALVPDLVLDVVEPAQQRLLLGDGQVGVDLRALLLADLAGRARVAEPVGLDLDPVALALDALVVLGEHDLVGHRRQVDLVGLLVQVVLLGEVLGVEVVADVDRLAVAVPLLRGLARLLGQREVLERAGVGEVFVAVPVAVPGLRRPDLHQREEPVEDLVEDLLVAPVLDQRDAQGGLEVRLVGEHPRLAGAGHGVEGLGDRDPDLAQPQQPDEPVQRVLHQPSPAAHERALAAQAGAEAAGAAVRRHLRLRGPRARPAAPSRGSGSSPRRGGPRRPSPRGSRDRRSRRRPPRGRRVVVLVVVVPVAVPMAVAMAVAVLRDLRVRVDEPGQRLERAPDVAVVLDDHRRGVRQHRRRRAPRRRAPPACAPSRSSRRCDGALRSSSSADPAHDLDQLRRQRVGQPGVLGPDDLQLALRRRVVEEQVQAAALERGREVAGVVGGEDRRTAAASRTNVPISGTETWNSASARAARPRAPRRRGRPRR